MEYKGDNANELTSFSPLPTAPPFLLSSLGFCFEGWSVWV